MKVSIITVCLNSAKTIRNALESAKVQSYKLIEVIVIDGVSTDDTLHILKQLKNEGLPLYLHSDDEPSYLQDKKMTNLLYATIIWSKKHIPQKLMEQVFCHLPSILHR